jgi:8-oxo-dGTP pyrophosphatase MutT (NUDIX family)
MRALKATASPPSAGGWGNNPAPYIGPGPSPLVMSYNESYGGHAMGTSAALPRDWRTFLSGMFGPLAPIQPVPIDIPEPGEQRPEPRRWEYPVSYNMPGYQPGQQGLGRLASFATLRTLCDLYSVARNSINLRKNELRSVGWDIAPTRQAAKAMRGDHRAAADFAERRAKMVKFFRHPDPDYSDFTSWFFAILEEFFVTDAISLFLHPSRVKGKGLMGSSLAALEVIDGSLIKPLVNVRGGRPAPPSPAYQQFEYGVPRVDLMTLLVESQDDPDPDGLLAEYKGDQLIYMPYMPRVWTPYGFAPIEGALIPVISGLNKQQYQSNYFNEGSIPGVYISPGDTSMTPSQLRELQDAMNAISGDQSWKHKILVLPGGSKVDPMRPNPLADDFDLLVQTQTCMGFDVQPFELGIAPQVSLAASSSGTARQAASAKMDLWQRKSTIPTLLFFKSVLFDVIIQDVCGQTDMEFRLEGLQDDENIGELTPALVEQVGAGLASIDEARLELGREPWGLPITSDPGWATQWGGLVPLTGVTEATAQPLGGSPGPGGAGRGMQQKPKQAATAQDFTTPGGDPGVGAPGPATVPRNRMSTAQRHDQARQIHATQNDTGSRGTPAHSGATAHAGVKPAAGSRASKEADPLREAITKALLSDDGVPVITDAPAAATKSALRELGLLRAHLRRGGAVSAWEPRTLSQGLLAGVSESLAKGMTVDLACDVAKAAITAPKAAAAPADAAEVFGQMRENFPKKAIRWVKDASWTRQQVPLSRIDFQDVGSWAASHEKRRVEHCAHDIESGVIKPVVMVAEPGKHTLTVIDGHHHTLAYRKLGRPVEAYVGQVASDSGPWLETHSSQVCKDGKDLVAAGLAVRAADTGRILMLQRAYDGDDPAGGYWELPGGRLDDGESAIEAARREWAEEVGVKVPAGDLDGIWNASNGRYRGFVLTVASEDAVDAFGDRDEVDNPDHDPDEDSIEALAWWDPAQLKDNPAVRPELAGDFKRIRRALRKSAETPVVSTVHHPLGHEGLWHTPDKHVREKQSLPAYFQNVARAIARDGGGDPEDKIPEAIEAVREWSNGTAFGGKVKVTPEVQQAARRALAEWDRLKASHH